jgi:tetratricopeptide (TPR) repeat protein
MNKKLLLTLAIVLVVIVIGATIIHMYFFDPSRTLYSEGQTFSANGDYSSAIEKYQMLVTEYPESGYANEANTSLLAECYYCWGSSLESELKYEEAIEKYQMALNYPKSSVVDTSQSAMLDCYYEWGQDLQSQNDYGGALEKYQAIIDIDEFYLSSESTISMNDVILDCYYEWGQDLESQDNYGEALEKYQAIVDIDEFYYPSGSNLSLMEEAIPQCYYRWVAQLVAAEQYSEAIQKYSLLLRDYSYSMWASSEKADVLKNIPDDALFTFAKQYHQQMSYETAIRLYEVLLQYYPESRYASEAEKAKIEAEIAQIAGQEHGNLPPPSELPSEEPEEDAEYTITNDTSYVLTVLFSGPTTRSVILSPHATETITLEPGAYRVAAKVSDPSVIPYYGEETLSGSTHYESSFYIRTTFGW